MLEMDVLAPDLVKKMQMVLEQNRLETFKGWHFGDGKKCSAGKLAEAGFYYIDPVEQEDSKDAVQCFLCEKTLDGWEEDDDPWKEHRSHQSDCEFAALGKPMMDLKVKDLLKFQHRVLLREMESGKKRILEQLDKQREDTVLRLMALKKQLKKRPR